MAVLCKKGLRSGGRELDGPVGRCGSSCQQVPLLDVTTHLPLAVLISRLVGMRRAFSFCALLLLGVTSARAQAVTAADLAAVRAELAEDNKLVRTDFNSLEQRFEVLSKSVQQLAEALRRAESENRSLREAIAKATAGLASRKDLEQVLEQLKEVDKKRVDDGKATRESLSHLGEQLEKVAKIAATPVPTAPVEERRRPKSEPKSEQDRSSKHEEATPELPSEFYEHTVQEGESLGVILGAYNKEHGLKVKVADVLKANPKLKDPKKLFVGMKLRIPVVK